MHYFTAPASVLVLSTSLFYHPFFSLLQVTLLLLFVIFVSREVGRVDDQMNFMRRIWPSLSVLTSINKTFWNIFINKINLCIRNGNQSSLIMYQFRIKSNLGTLRHVKMFHLSSISCFPTGCLPIRLKTSYCTIKWNRSSILLTSVYYCSSWYFLLHLFLIVSDSQFICLWFLYWKTSFYLNHIKWRHTKNTEPSSAMAATV